MSREDGHVSDYPVVILGSGMSGAAVAGALARRGILHIVADVGVHSGTDHVACDETTRRWLAPQWDPAFRAVSDAPRGTHYGADSGGRLRVGGRSLYWRGIVLRLEDYAFDGWPARVVDVLQPGDGDAGFYAEVETRLRSWAPRLGEVRNADEAALLARLRSVGFGDAIPTPRAVRHHDGGLWSAYSPLCELANASVLSGMSMRAIEPRRDRVDLVFDSARGMQRLRAAAVVLCTGTIENARIVADLVARPGPYPLVDHHSQGWVCVLPEQSGDGEASVLVGRVSAGRFNSFAEIHRVQGCSVLDVWTMGEQLPSASSTVSFARDGSATFAVGLTPADHALLADQSVALDELRSALGLHALDDASADYDAALERAVSSPGVAVPYRCALGTIDHDACTLPLDGELVSTTGELRDVPRVFVGGPCLFPRPGAANPSLTIMALAGYVAREVEARVAPRA